MRKHCRSRVRTRGKKVLTIDARMVALYGYWQRSPRWREWVARTISQRQAQMLLASGEAEKVLRWKDGAVQCVGIRATTPTMCQRPSATSLTPHTMLAVAGMGFSNTTTTARAQAEVDKFHVWPLIRDHKAPLAGTAMSDADVARGLEVFRRYAGLKNAGRAGVQRIAA